jgi:hypothetical protein
MGHSSAGNLVKPNKIASRTTQQSGINQRLLLETESQIGAAGTAVLGKTDTGVGQELAGFDAVNAILDEFTELAPLLVRDGGPQVLDLGPALADEYDEGHFRLSGHPGVADQLRIESK